MRSPIGSKGHQAVDGAHVGHGVAVVVREAVVEFQTVRGVNGDEPPPAAGLLPLGAGHEVAGLAAGDKLVLLERGRPGGRAPPALKLARVFPDLPDALHAGVELGDHGEAQGLEILD